MSGLSRIGVAIDSDLLDKFDRLIGRFDQTQRFGFDRQANQTAGLGMDSIESRRCFQEQCGATVEMIGGVRKAFESERDGGDAPRRGVHHRRRL